MAFTSSCSAAFAGFSVVDYHVLRTGPRKGMLRSSFSALNACFPLVDVFIAHAVQRKWMWDPYFSTISRFSLVHILVLHTLQKNQCWNPVSSHKNGCQYLLFRCCMKAGRTLFVCVAYIFSIPSSMAFICNFRFQKMFLFIYRGRHCIIQFVMLGPTVWLDSLYFYDRENWAAHSDSSFLWATFYRASCCYSRCCSIFPLTYIPFLAH